MNDIPAAQQSLGRTPRVMIVDDEQMVTVSLSSMLEIETDYDVIAFQSPRAALDSLKETAVDLIISDFLMPELDGLQFLSEAKKLYPEVPRIILTGYADKENAIKGINEVGLYAYLEKPWDNDNLKLIVRNAIQDRGLRRALSSKIKELDAALAEREQLVRAGKEMQRELQMARELQRRLLPATDHLCPPLDLAVSYLPALDVGGDFYDVIPLAADRWAILVADATGHGVQASLSTALLKFAFGGFAGTDAGPCEILSGMNGILYTVLPTDIFVAAVVAVIDPRAASATLANAGLPHPFVVQNGGDDVQRVCAEGLLLGVVDQKLFNVGALHTIDLHPGDCMLLYTDGLTEATNSAGRQLVDTGFNSLLGKCRGKSPAEIVKLLCNTAVEFGKDGSYKDDLTILGLSIHAHEE